jgi:SAM-dependent methyltransferase
LGKQARRKRERSPGQAKAQRYLARLGLPERPNPLPYRRLMDADPVWYRSLAEADDAAVALAARDDADPAELAAALLARYRLVYRDLDTALAEYAARAVMIGAAWLRWWFDHHPPATRIVDLACGPGVLTCAYALALPEAEVVGVDAVPEALACAEELARRLGAGNVSFVSGDIADPAGAEDFAGAVAGCDQLMAVTAFSDAGFYPHDPPDARQALSSVADVDGPGRAFRSAGVSTVVERVAPGAAVLAFDRTPDPSLAVRFGAALLHAGVDLDLRRAGVEVFVEEGVPMTFTRFVGQRAGGDGPDGADDGEAALVAWLKRVRPPAYGVEWHDELRFEALKSKGAKLVWGAEIDYTPRTPAVERREIWELGSEVYGWISTTPRHRQLESGRTVEDLWREYSSLAGQLAAVGFEVRYYDG